MSNYDAMFRPNVFFGLAYIEAFADPTAPTAAELNNAVLVKDITCALDEDGTEFTLGDSETDDSTSFCDASGVTTLTTKNATVVYKAFRDRDRIATGVYNLAFDHLAFADIPYFAVQRLGKANTSAFAIGDVVRLVQVNTDNPVDNVGVDSNVTIQNSFLTNGLVNWNFKLTA